MAEFRFVVIGGPHRGPGENPTCYVRTTQRGAFVRWTKPRISKRTGELLAPHLTPWARYQDYIEHVRRSLTSEQTELLQGPIWYDLSHGDCMRYHVDAVVQFAGKAHSDPDHVASTIADALFPGPPRSKPGKHRERLSYSPVWPRHVLENAPGDSRVLASVRDYRDGCETAFVAVSVHGPYDRFSWYDEAVAWNVIGRTDVTRMLGQIMAARLPSAA